MTLNELLDDYKKMAQICYNIDNSDKNSVKNNNRAVSRMYQIVNTIKTEFGEAGVCAFAELMDFKENRTDLWAAVQMLEKMQVDTATEQKALIIIKQEARQSLGMDYWLKTYKEQNRK
jgi:hypothetical protein